METLIVSAIVGAALLLLLPAIQSSRRVSVTLRCQNNLRQLALAARALASAHNHLPTGGWGGSWIGQPGRGVGRDQPGAWTYCLLPYLQRDDLAGLGRGQQGAKRRAALSALLQQGVSAFNCPARRQPLPYPIFYSYAQRPRGANPIMSAVRGDYAANAGDQRPCEVAYFGGPPSIEAVDSGQFGWPDTSDHTGVVFLRSEITLGGLRDGAGHTYLFGEKYLSVSDYASGGDHGDDWNVYVGFQDDTCRTAFFRMERDHGRLGGRRGCCRFGGPHSGGWPVAFCDASVRVFNWNLAPAIHKNLANRDDGAEIDDAIFGR